MGMTVISSLCWPGPIFSRNHNKAVLGESGKTWIILYRSLHFLICEKNMAIMLSNLPYMVVKSCWILKWSTHMILHSHRLLVKTVRCSSKCNFPFSLRLHLHRVPHPFSAATYIGNRSCEEVICAICGPWA